VKNSTKTAAASERTRLEKDIFIMPPLAALKFKKCKTESYERFRLYCKEKKYGNVLNIKQAICIAPPTYTRVLLLFLSVLYCDLYMVPGRQINQEYDLFI